MRTERGRLALGAVLAAIGLAALFIATPRLPDASTRLYAPIVPLIFLVSALYLSLARMRELDLRLGVLAAYTVDHEEEDWRALRRALRRFISVAPVRTRGLALMLRAAVEAFGEDSDFLNSLSRGAHLRRGFNPGVARIVAEIIPDPHAAV